MYPTFHKTFTYLLYYAALSVLFFVRAIRLVSSCAYREWRANIVDCRDSVLSVRSNTFAILWLLRDLLDDLWNHLRSYFGAIQAILWRNEVQRQLVVLVFALTFIATVVGPIRLISPTDGHPSRFHEVPDHLVCANLLHLILKGHRFCGAHVLGQTLASIALVVFGSSFIRVEIRKASRRDFAFTIKYGEWPFRVIQSILLSCRVFFTYALARLGGMIVCTIPNAVNALNGLYTTGDIRAFVRSVDAGLARPIEGTMISFVVSVLLVPTIFFHPRWRQLHRGLSEIEEEAGG